MLTEYLEKAMKHTVYEEMEEGGFFGHIPELKGPWADRRREPELWRQAVVRSGWPACHVLRAPLAI